MPKMNREFVSFYLNRNKCQSVFMISILIFFSQKHSWSKQQKALVSVTANSCNIDMSNPLWCRSVQVKGSWLYRHKILMLVMRSLFDQKSYDYYSIVRQEKEDRKTDQKYAHIYIYLWYNRKSNHHLILKDYQTKWKINFHHSWWRPLYLETTKKLKKPFCITY